MVALFSCASPPPPPAVFLSIESENVAATMQEALNFLSTTHLPLPPPLPTISLHFSLQSPTLPSQILRGCPSLSTQIPSLIISPENETPPASSPPRLQELLLYLDSLGVDSLYCLHSHPPLISAPLFQVKCTVDFLFSLGLTVQDLRRIFAICPDLLTSPTSMIIIPAATFLLREAHVDAVNLRHVIYRRPRLLTRSVDRQLRPTLYFLQGTIGIENVANCAFLLSCCVESKFIPRIEYLQKLGFSYMDTVVMFRRFPALFCYSMKENLKPKFDYFVVEMGRELKELVAFPQYFSFSFDKRIKPRHKMCVEKQVCLSLAMMLKSYEGRFRDLLEVYCDSSIPVRASPLWITNTNIDHVNV